MNVSLHNGFDAFSLRTSPTISLPQRSYNVSLRPLHKLAEKKKWLTRFYGSYDGNLRPINDAMFGEECRYFVSVDGSKELGFIVLTNHTKDFEKFGVPSTWNLEDGYVKPPYRKCGVLRDMIELAVDRLDVKSLRIQESRYIRCLSYYQSLGFTITCCEGDGMLTVFHSSFADEVETLYLDCVKNGSDRMRKFD